jgi:hypothetical protein
VGDLSANPPLWSSAINLGATNFFQYDSTHPSRVTGANLVAGPHGSNSNGSLWYKFWATSSSDIGSGALSLPNSTGCMGNTATLEWLPESDVFGTALDNTSYNALSRSWLDGANRATATSTNWTRASYNASANAAARARTTRNLWDGRNFPGVFVYAIGLGSVNHGLMQRMANDPSPGPNGEYGAYSGYNTNHPVGAYVYAQNSSQLSSAFAQIASFILRLSQ